MRKTLSKYLPIEVVPLVESIIKEKKIHFSITPNRKSKAGDYRSPYKKWGHKISINGSMNKYAFTITFFHEYAHLLVWENYGNKVYPHGKEWKLAFSRILVKLLSMNFFPKNLQTAINQYSINPLASTQSDIFLSQVLREFDNKKTFHKTVLELQSGNKFKMDDGRTFVRGELKRTRIWCKEYGTNIIFAFNPNAEVIEI